jgi:hypothetical protein
VLCVNDSPMAGGYVYIKYQPDVSLDQPCLCNNRHSCLYFLEGGYKFTPLDRNLLGGGRLLLDCSVLKENR